MKTHSQRCGRLKRHRFCTDYGSRQISTTRSAEGSGRWPQESPHYHVRPNVSRSHRTREAAVCRRSAMPLCCQRMQRYAAQTLPYERQPVPGNTASKANILSRRAHGSCIRPRGKAPKSPGDGHLGSCARHSAVQQTLTQCKSAHCNRVRPARRLSMPYSFARPETYSVLWHHH
jgi:hypothetical protein